MSWMPEWVSKAPALFSSAAEDSLENLVYVAQLPLQGKSCRDLFRAQALPDLRVLLDRHAEIALFLPTSHRVALHDAISLLAQHAGRGQVQQKLSGKYQP